MIQWAAFYSDCEHEIKTISHGERITLTYNIYHQESPNQIRSISSILDPKTLLLHGDLENALRTPEFMEEGGILGIFCSHAYPHTSHDFGPFLPQGLKGADLIVYNAFHSFGIQVDVLPVVIEDLDGDSDSVGLYSVEGGSLVKNYKNYYSPEEMDYFEFDGVKVHVGAKLWPYKCTDNYTCDCPVWEAISDDWPETQFDKEITWIATPQHNELALNYIAYGNEPSQGEIYSYAAIFAVILPWSERKASLDNKSFEVPYRVLE